ncbi:hypothetical protein JRQ81_000461, partial [Phrynocephalus forsythii]
STSNRENGCFRAFGWSDCSWSSVNYNWITYLLSLSEKMQAKNTARASKLQETQLFHLPKTRRTALKSSLSAYRTDSIANLRTSSGSQRQL